MSFYRECAEKCSKRNEKTVKELYHLDELLMYEFEKHLITWQDADSPLNSLERYVQEHMPDPDTLAEDLKGQQPRSGYNSWPFGLPDTKVLPRFLAVCNGKCKLEEAMKETDRQCVSMAIELERDEPKTVFFITDKWDPKVFKKYEGRFLLFALIEKIWFAFILVDDYGFTQIPFLPNNRNTEIEVPADLNRLYRLLGNKEISYVKYNGWGCEEKYHFVAGTLKWRCDIPGKECGGDIRREDMDTFLKDTAFMAVPSGHDLYDFMRYGVDNPHRKLKVFSKYAMWNVPDEDRRTGMDVRLERAAEKLVGACLKNAP
ncbi:MAG: hypothetical protein IK101_04260 [Oscillospiraceae bacterium]|nr:hypothetical protein [Oscillospiraceae bacterium]